MAEIEKNKPDQIMNFKPGFVFTNYNNTSVTLDLINSIYRNESLSNCPVIIVDNHSDAENKKALSEIAGEFKMVTIIENDENIGYFKGLNLGIKYLRNLDEKADVIIIGNNDLVFPSDFSDTLLQKSTLFEKYPVISPNIVTLDGVHQNPHVIKNISKLREFVFDLYFKNYYMARAIKAIASATKSFTDRKDEEQHDIARTIYQGYGACYILTPVFFLNFEELWAPTFLMGEEFFLSKQLESKNFRTYYEPTITVKHQCHATMDKMPARKIWEYARDSHILYRKFVSVWK